MNSCRILIVEDEAVVALELEERLTAMGYRVAGRADSGERALALIEAEHPHLVVMDIRLQGDVDGIAAAVEIRNRFHIPVIFLTAYSEDETLERAKLAEPHGYLLKPFNDRELKSAVEIALYKHRTEEEIRRLNRLYNVLSQVNQTVVRVETREELLPEVCRLMVERGEIDLAWIGWLDPAASRITPVARFGNRSESLDGLDLSLAEGSESKGQPRRSLLEGEPFVCNSCSEADCLYPFVRPFAQRGFQSCGAFPLRFQGRVCATLNLCVSEPEFFRSREIDLLKEVALDISFALDKIENRYERERSQTALREANNRLKALFEGVRDAIVITDPDTGLLLEVNAEAERLMGQTRENLVGLHYTRLHPVEHFESYRKAFQRHTGSRVPFHIEAQILRADGGTVPVEISGGMVDLGNGQHVVQALFRDITERKAAEEEADGQREMLSSIFDSAPIIMMLVDPEGRVTKINRTGAAFAGRPKDELLGLLGGEVFNCLNALTAQGCGKKADCADCPVRTKVMYTLRTGESIFDAEGVMTVRRGSEDVPVEVLISTVPVRDRDADQVLVILSDITERKRAERALRESEATARTVLNIPNAAAFLLDREGICLDANETLARRFSRATSEIIGKPIWDLFPPQVREPRRARFLKVLHTGKQERFEDEREGLWSDVVVSPILDDRGAVSKITVFAFDITERKRTEEALRESEERLRTLINSTPDIVCFKDGEGRWLEANKAALELLELTDANYRGRKDSELARFSDFYRDAFLTCEGTDELTWQKRATTRGEEVIPRPDGTNRVYDVIKVPLFHADGRRKGLVVLGRDITERKQAEEDKSRIEAQLLRAQKMEAIGTLAGGIAHDFNNILAPIIGYTEMAMDDVPTGSPMRHDLEQVLFAANRARELVKQILAFSRHGQDQQMIPIEVSPVIKEALKLLRASLPASIEIEQNIQKGMAQADATQIHQIIVNLSTNAAYAMDGKGTLRVSLAKVYLSARALSALPLLDLKPGPYLKLSVADTGQGMNVETMQRIFEPYYTTKEVGKGTGLGLAVVHGIVKRHQGAIDVRSEPGKGSIFDVYIPMLEETSEAVRDASQTLPRGTERILLVDDEQMIADLGARMLKQLGYRVEARTSAREALEALQSNPRKFDLLITDYTMPQLSGIELAREVLEIRPDLPIVLCTGFNEKATVEAAKIIGIRELIMKPLDRSELARLVRRVLDGKS